MNDYVLKEIKNYFIDYTSDSEILSIPFDKSGIYIVIRPIAQPLLRRKAVHIGLAIDNIVYQYGDKYPTNIDSYSGLYPIYTNFIPDGDIDLFFRGYSPYLLPIREQYRDIIMSRIRSILECTNIKDVNPNLRHFYNLIICNCESLVSYIVTGKIHTTQAKTVYENLMGIGGFASVFLAGVISSRYKELLLDENKDEELFSKYHPKKLEDILDEILNGYID